MHVPDKTLPLLTWEGSVSQQPDFKPINVRLQFQEAKRSCQREINHVSSSLVKVSRPEVARDYLGERRHGQGRRSFVHILASDCTQIGFGQGGKPRRLARVI